MKKYKVLIIFIILIILMILGVLLWNRIIDKQNKKLEEEKTKEVIDVSDVNNVNSVEKGLGEDIKITQKYLLNYVKYKSGTWYLSQGIIKSIKDDGINSIIKITDNENTIVTSISKDKVNVSKGDKVYFVGTIDLKDDSMDLAKISKEDINYNSAIKIEFNDLYNNIKQVKSNYFIVSGYLVTDNDKYKLYTSKSLYKEDSSSNYFLIEWDGKFNYTGNQDVTIRCQISDTYKLGNCTLEN